MVGCESRHLIHAYNIVCTYVNYLTVRSITLSEIHYCTYEMGAIAVPEFSFQKRF